MKNQCFLFILGIVLTLTTAYGQRIPYGLQIEKVQKEINEKTKQFDSLVFVDKANFWNDDQTINGFGFIDNKVKKVKIYFLKDTASFYDIKIQKVKTETIKNKNKADFIKNYDYYRVENFHNDSLNVKSRTNIVADITDQPTWTILIIKKKEFILKQSYAPEFYREKAPTLERKEFMEIMKTLNEKTK